MIFESHNEDAEFQLANTREICYWIANSQSTKHISREKIMPLPSEAKKIALQKKYETEEAERFLKKISRK